MAGADTDGAVAGTAVPGLRRCLGGRPGFLLARIGLVAAGPLPGPAVDPRAGPLAILEILRRARPGRRRGRRPGREE